MGDALPDTVLPVSALVERVADREFVLLGEASHGTREFYELRATVTRRLVEQHGFRAVAWEADWPPAAGLTRWLRGAAPERDARAALSGFAERFPTWMWANETVLPLADELRGGPAGVYGLDLYSLRSSMAAVIEHLDRVDPEAARRARQRYACFDRFDDQAYGRAAATGRTDSCEDDVVAELVELRQRASRSDATATTDPEAAFVAEQNARVAANAEHFYRAMYRGRESTWNLRDRHMADTLDALHEHVGGPVVVWAHNSHVGDARATDRTDRGELTLGQLVRERHGDRCVLVGQTTSVGTVTAAHDWGDPPRTHDVRPPLTGSLERPLHEAGIQRGLIDLRGPARPLLDHPLLQRLIGVLYRPRTERQSHYVQARVTDQYDLLVHTDRTHHVVPLQPTSRGAPGPDAPKTLPSGLFAAHEAWRTGTPGAARHRRRSG